MIQKNVYSIQHETPKCVSVLADDKQSVCLASNYTV
jgi:hypothetical protein